MWTCPCDRAEGGLIRPETYTGSWSLAIRSTWIVFWWTECRVCGYGDMPQRKGDNLIKLTSSSFVTLLCTLCPCIFVFFLFRFPACFWPLTHPTSSCNLVSVSRTAGVNTMEDSSRRLDFWWQLATLNSLIQLWATPSLRCGEGEQHSDIFGVTTEVTGVPWRKISAAELFSIGEVFLPFGEWTSLVSVPLFYLLIRPPHCPVIWTKTSTISAPPNKIGLLRNRRFLKVIGYSFMNEIVPQIRQRKWAK